MLVAAEVVSIKVQPVLLATEVSVVAVEADHLVMHHLIQQEVDMLTLVAVAVVVHITLLWAEMELQVL